MDPVVHFELPFEDKDRASKFYEESFGWKMSKLGPDMMDYVLAQTNEINPETRFPLEPGKINGGMFQKSEGNTHPSIVIAVKNIEEAIKKIEAAGGKVLGEPVMIPGNGRYVSFVDTEGNRNSIIEPLPM